VDYSSHTRPSQRHLERHTQQVSSFAAVWRTSADVALLAPSSSGWLLRHEHYVPDVHHAVKFHVGTRIKPRLGFVPACGKFMRTSGEGERPFLLIPNATPSGSRTVFVGQSRNAIRHRSSRSRSTGGPRSLVPKGGSHGIQRNAYRANVTAAGSRASVTVPFDEKCLHFRLIPDQVGPACQPSSQPQPACGLSSAYLRPCKDAKLQLKCMQLKTSHCSCLSRLGLRADLPGPWEA